nr:FKBP-type peptidyl-prolyl cis-trans isomerase [Motilibacter aurantiacus]
MAVLPVLALSASLVLAGCGDDGEETPDASSTSSAAAVGSGELPSVSGAYGEKPTISFEGDAPKALQKEILDEGDGPEVQSGDLLVADYLGQVWGGEVFDNSYDRGQVAAFPIGVGQVVSGWDETLVGVKAGSRVLMSLPPDKGYGANGNEQAGIKGTDTLVFVVDVVGSYGKSSGAQADAAQKDAPPAGITVSGAPGAAPKVTVAKTYKAPAKAATTVLAEGTGPAVASGQVIGQYVAVDAKGSALGSTWESTPQAIPVAVEGQPGPFDALVGVPAGSRVLLQVPPTAANQSTGQQASPGVVAVVDVVAQAQTAKDSAK